MGLVLAFDTATHVATVAIVAGGSRSPSARRAFRVLADADELLAELGAAPEDIDSARRRHGPGQLHRHEARARARTRFALARGVPVAGVSTLDALAAGAPGALPVIDAGRREVFTTLNGEPRALPASELDVDGMTCIGDGALRYRTRSRSGRGRPPD